MTQVGVFESVSSSVFLFFFCVSKFAVTCTEKLCNPLGYKGIWITLNSEKSNYSVTTSMRLV